MPAICSSTLCNLAAPTLALPILSIRFLMSPSRCLSGRWTVKNMIFNTSLFFAIHALLKPQTIPSTFFYLPVWQFCPQLFLATNLCAELKRKYFPTELCSLENRIHLSKEWGQDAGRVKIKQSVHKDKSIFSTQTGEWQIPSSSGITPPPHLNTDIA